METSVRKALFLPAISYCALLHFQDRSVSPVDANYSIHSSILSIVLFTLLLRLNTYIFTYCSIALEIAMYIEEIILEGFKSYANRTVISGWDPEFNAITGLNGSGKSNILDAICFVLGIENLRSASHHG